MQLKECYDSFGGDYEEVTERIPNDALVKRLVIKFLADASYEKLCAAVEAGDYTEAFRQAHTLKGICQNLSFRKLSISASALTELLRNKEEHQIDKEQCSKLWQKVSADYEEVVGAIRKLEQ